MIAFKLFGIVFDFTPIFIAVWAVSGCLAFIMALVFSTVGEWWWFSVCGIFSVLWVATVKACDDWRVKQSDRLSNSISFLK